MMSAIFWQCRCARRRTRSSVPSAQIDTTHMFCPQDPGYGGSAPEEGTDGQREQPYRPFLWLGRQAPFLTTSLVTPAHHSASIPDGRSGGRQVARTAGGGGSVSNRGSRSNRELRR